MLAVEVAGQEHTFNVDKFDSLIGYSPPVDVNESVKRTRDWRKRKYSNLKVF